MSNKELNNLKNIINETKSVFDIVSNELQSKVDTATNLIQQLNVNYLDLVAHINTWYSVIIECDNYEQLSAFIPLNTVNNAIHNFNGIKNALTSYQTDFNIQHLINANFINLFETSKSYMLHFLPYVKGNFNEAIKKITHFTKEKEAIDKYLVEAKTLCTNLNDKEKEITNFYNKLLHNDSSTTDDKRGIKQFIEDSFNKITQQYNKLFVEKQSIKIGDKDVQLDGMIGKTNSYIEDIENYKTRISIFAKDIEEQKKKIEISRIDFKLQIGDALTPEDKKFAQDNNLNEEIDGIKKTKEEYEGYMQNQRREIDKMNSETKKSLGNHVNALMVRTFREEAILKEKEARFMFKCSIGFITAIAIFGLIWIFSFNIDGFELYKYGIKLVHDVNNVGQKWEWITFAYRAMIFLPLGVGFWFCNKRHDVCSLLAAEYRYKRSIVEAMIGYRANYETSDKNQFTDTFSKEYTKFFDKTFEEINKNPAEKINKMLMKNKFSIEALIDKALDSKKKDEN